MRAEGQAPPRHKRRLRRDVKWGITAFVVVLVAEYLVMPEARRGPQVPRSAQAGERRPTSSPGFCSRPPPSLSYALLTRAVLPQGVIRLGRLLRIDLSAFATSHVVPGGSAPGTALSYRLLTESGVEGADAAFASRHAGHRIRRRAQRASSGSLLVISLFIHGYNPLYLVAAGVGVVLDRRLRGRRAPFCSKDASARSRSCTASPTSCPS